MYKLLITCALFSIYVDTMSGQGTESAGGEKPQLNLERAQYLHQFALECIDQEYPNKTGHVLGSETSAYKPRIIHPAFYGCFDWHSSVHGHWTLVQLLKQFPELDAAAEIRTKLLQHITGPNILQEAAYFSDPHNRNFERTYGWAWAFKLAEALHAWDDPDAALMSRNLQPLIDTLEQRLYEFLPKLNYPIRVGEHTNTAFALSLTCDYAKSLRRDTLLKLIGKRSRDYYLSDRNCPVTWEPSGFDFLSPCLQEASLMAKVLPTHEFFDWLNAFLPGLTDHPEALFQPAEVSDREDGKLAHLDGLNFSRAWCLFEIGGILRHQPLIDSGTEHFQASYDKIDSGFYAGTHWLASFALYALLQSEALEK